MRRTGNRTGGSNPSLSASRSRPCFRLEYCDALRFPKWELGAAPVAAPWQLKRSRALLLMRLLGGFHTEPPWAQPADRPCLVAGIRLLVHSRLRETKSSGKLPP